MKGLKIKYKPSVLFDFTLDQWFLHNKNEHLHEPELNLIAAVLNYKAGLIVNAAIRPIQACQLLTDTVKEVASQNGLQWNFGEWTKHLDQIMIQIYGTDWHRRNEPTRETL